MKLRVFIVRPLVTFAVMVFLSFAAELAASTAVLADLSAREIVEKNFYVTKLQHISTDTTMTLTNDKGQQRANP